VHTAPDPKPQPAPTAGEPHDGPGSHRALGLYAPGPVSDTRGCRTGRDPRTPRTHARTRRTTSSRTRRAPARAADGHGTRRSSADSREKARTAGNSGGKRLTQPSGRIAGEFGGKFFRAGVTARAWLKKGPPPCRGGWARGVVDWVSSRCRRSRRLISADKVLLASAASRSSSSFSRVVIWADMIASCSAVGSHYESLYGVCDGREDRLWSGRAARGGRPIPNRRIEARGPPPPAPR
jgi:hypothetical protein